jgi:NhaA family Na+:H+ antiporter
VNSKALSRSQRVARLTTLATLLLAFLLASSPLRDGYQVVHHLPVMVWVGTLALDKALILPHPRASRCEHDAIIS